ncbi:MAG: hypothetical protein MZV64_34255 [Ignavibacteriales bacterium]|nr:hypothetical protein [Ignavibacteriales bacterium]
MPAARAVRAAAVASRTRLVPQGFEARPGPAVVRLELEDLLVLGEGLVPLPPGFVDLDQADPGGDHRRRALDRGLEPGLRGGQVAGEEVRVGQLRFADRVGRAELHQELAGLVRAPGFQGLPGVDGRDPVVQLEPHGLGRQVLDVERRRRDGRAGAGPGPEESQRDDGDPLHHDSAPCSR